jgi:hypothetical protein
LNEVVYLRLFSQQVESEFANNFIIHKKFLTKGRGMQHDEYGPRFGNYIALQQSSCVISASRTNRSVGNVSIMLFTSKPRSKETGHASSGKKC